MVVPKAIIVGGGISGLYTALGLQKAGVSFLLLEAKSQFGGRIAGQPVLPGGDLFVDLGPTWFWPHQKRLMHLLKELRIDWFEHYCIGDTLYHDGSTEAVSRIPGNPGNLLSYRVEGGMLKLIEALMKQLDSSSLKTEHVVAEIKKKVDGWQVSVLQHGREYLFRADELVLAVPPRLIVRDLTAEHYLSRGLVAALQAQHTWMSGQAKFVAVYDKPFWREHGLSGQAFSRVGPLVEIHDGSATPHSGFALFGFIGLQAETRSHLSADHLASRCLAQLGLLFGSEALDTEVYYLKDWAQDKRVATSRDVNQPPAHPVFFREDHQDELDSLGLHLAVSECAPRDAGYVEGALLAGDAAVERVSARSLSVKQIIRP